MSVEESFGYVGTTIRQSPSATPQWINTKSKLRMNKYGTHTSLLVNSLKENSGSYLMNLPRLKQSFKSIRRAQIDAKEKELKQLEIETKKKEKHKQELCNKKKQEISETEWVFDKSVFQKKNSQKKCLNFN